MRTFSVSFYHFLTKLIEKIYTKSSEKLYIIMS